LPAREARPAISEELAKSLLRSGAAHVEVEPRSYAYAEIALQIRRLIEQGRLRPGDRLPPERDVAAVLGVSRTSVRDAIRVLEMRGLLEPRPGQGTIVRAFPTREIRGRQGGAPTPAAGRAADLLDLCRLLEPPLARSAARKASARDLDALEAIVQRQAQRVRAGEPAVEEEQAFHYRLAVSARRPMILKAFGSILSMLRAQNLHAALRPQDWTDAVEAHRRILAAVRRRDPDAAADEMLGHIETAQRLLAATASRPGTPALT
jgi:GntR family transcriptional repressor for pyruvate dehydrogenase complex